MDKFQLERLDRGHNDQGKVYSFISHPSEVSGR
jgi:hypothetical protein